MKKIIIEERAIAMEVSRNGEDYISLTDMAKFRNAKSTGIIIAHWLSNMYTIQFMGAWEQVFNPSFNVTEFRNIKNESGTNDNLRQIEVADIE